MDVLEMLAGLGDPRAAGWLAEASGEVGQLWSGVREAVGADPPVMGLAAGERPTADVEVLAGVLGSCEFLLATRMHAAASAGCLALGERGGVLVARGWSRGLARRLARCAALAADHPGVAGPWAAGIITSEHLDPIARAVERFSRAELAALLAELGPHWGAWSPGTIGQFVAAADRMLHPPADPGGDEVGAYACRAVSFAVTADSVILSGELPRVEGELVIAAIDAVAERVRSTADHVPAAARRADALVQLVNDAHAAGVLPTRGGLPVSVTVTVEHTAAGDPVVRTSRGHLLTEAETRWAGCDAVVRPILVPPPGCAGVADWAPDSPGGLGPVSAAGRIAALASLMFTTRIPLGAGRAQRTATPAQRAAIAVRDRGCIIPGCRIPAEACQVHHLQEWADGGRTDLDNLVSLCWAHHRQVDLHMWTITPTPPDHQKPPPPPGSPPGSTWPANHGAPFLIQRTARHIWRT